MKKELLYHYTSIETLALILQNKTICFNNLLYVDDAEESETNDLGSFGRYANISCWTADKEESIPLWNLYTPNMKGVRIGLPKFPFKKYYFKAGQFSLATDIETYINLELIYNLDTGSIVPSMPELIEVEYTNDEKKIYPIIRKCDNLPLLMQIINTGEYDGGQLNVKYSFQDLGRYKRSNWSFQNEWRYIIRTAPISIKAEPTIKGNIDYVRKLEDNKSIAPYNSIFLDIDEKFLDDMEILIGPNTNESEKIIINSLIRQYAPKAILKQSNLKIRSRLS